jgi:pyruvate dehydrogenase E1 component
MPLRNHSGQPTVILAHTKKGYGMGQAGQGKMTTHSQKKLDEAALIEFRNRFNLPLTDAQATHLEFFKPAEDSAEMRTCTPGARSSEATCPKGTQQQALPVPALASYAAFATQAAGKEMSTTMAFVRLLGNLLKDAQLGPRIVPIVADEARTFGMANLFRQVGIYSAWAKGTSPRTLARCSATARRWTARSWKKASARPAPSASWTAAATSYSVHDLPMLPFYIYYSMFGFQRVGDAIWAAADQRARGFLLGATSGRTTLAAKACSTRTAPAT